MLRASHKVPVSAILGSTDGESYREKLNLGPIYMPGRLTEQEFSITPDTCKIAIKT